MTIGAARYGVAAAALLFATGCAGGLGNIGSVLGGGAGGGAGAGQGQGQLLAEIQQVQPQQQLLQVRTQDGQTGAVAFDQNTQVIYRQQQYPVTALERGDIVAMQVQQLSSGAVYTGRIEVQQSVQERTGQAPPTQGSAVQQYYGSVRQIDHNAGVLELQLDIGGRVTVAMPPSASQAATQYFRGLSVGDQVRLEAVPAGGGRLELHRFL